MLNGPRKLILIHSGRYDYAEVELAGALQIVGPNNTGKTTLINTLQLLYIEEWQKMDFGTYSSDQTRDYYFPDEHSYVLFECLGEQGVFVFGWRGETKLSGAKPARFVFTGPFEHNDFFDGEQMREPRAVNGRLAMKDFRVLTSAEHRALFLPRSREHPLGQGLVPVKDAGRFPQFRDTLKNLLTLTNLTQEQMRDRLLMLAGFSVDAVALDVRDLLREDYDLKREERRRLERFKKAEGELRILVERFRDREELRGELMHRWRDLRERREPFRGAHQKKVGEWQRQIDEKESALSNLGDEIAAHEVEKTHCAVRLGGWQDKLSTLDGQTKKFADFLTEFEQSAHARLCNEVGEITSLLKSADTEDAPRVQQRLKGDRRDLDQKKRAAANFDRLVVSALRRDFTDAELTTLFQILSFDLLETPVGDDGVEIHHPTGLRDFLRAVLAGVREGAYRDARVSVHLREPRRRVEDVANAEALRVQAEDLSRRIAADEQLLTAIQRRDELRIQLQTKTAQRDAKAKRLHEYADYEQNIAQQPTWLAGIAKEEAALQGWTEKIKVLRGRAGEMKTAQTTLEADQKTERQAYARVMNDLEACHPAAFLCPMISTSDIPENFDSAIAYYTKEWQRAERLDSDVTLLLSEAEKHLGADFREPDDAETIRKLGEELEALPEKEDALNRDWRALLQGMKRTFADVLKDLESVKSTANDLTRAFARVQVSNLKSVAVKVVEQADLVGRVQSLSRLDELDLFGDLARLDDAIESFRRALEVRPVVLFSHLFALGFQVTGRDGKTKVHTDFRQIESDGTTVALKVVFSLLVLRSLLKEGRAPFHFSSMKSRRSIHPTAVPCSPLRASLASSPSRPRRARSARWIPCGFWSRSRTA
jgi:hypothetical protein